MGRRRKFGLPFKTTVVTSIDDTCVTLERARLFAEAWGAHLEMIGALSHMGSDAKLGTWLQGRRWLDELQARDRRTRCGLHE